MSKTGSTGEFCGTRKWRKLERAEGGLKGGVLPQWSLLAKEA